MGSRWVERIEGAVVNMAAKVKSAIQMKRDWINRQPLGGSRKAVLRCLVDHANNQTGKCYPSQDRIHEETGLSINTVKRAIWVLKAVMVIRVERKIFNRHGRMGVRNTYTMRYEFVASTADVKAAEIAVNQPRPKSHSDTLMGHDQSPTVDGPKSHHESGTIQKNSATCVGASQLSIFCPPSGFGFGCALATVYRGSWRKFGDDSEVIWGLLK